MVLHHIIQCIFFLTGTAALTASIFNQDWLFTSKNAEPVVKRFGRNASRWLYGTTGILFITTAIYFYFHIKGMK